MAILLSCVGKKSTQDVSFKGSWKATAFKIGDSLANFDISASMLNLKPDSRYSFTNNIGQVEAGTYQVYDSLLIMTDTTVRPSREKAVQLIKIKNDSLIFRMNYKDREAFMYFIRK